MVASAMPYHVSSQLSALLERRLLLLSLLLSRGRNLSGFRLPVHQSTTFKTTIAVRMPLLWKVENHP